MTFLMKIVLCGDSNSGKQELKEKYMGRRVNFSAVPGFEVFLKEDVIEGRTIRFQIWDLAGQVRSGKVRPVYYLGALGSILVFDVTKSETFENAQNWINEVWEHNGKGPIPTVLLGNNVPLRDQYPDSITDELAQKYCTKLSEQTKSFSFEVKYFPTSTETGLNVNECFEYLGKIYFEYMAKYNLNST